MMLGLSNKQINDIICACKTCTSKLKISKLTGLSLYHVTCVLNAYHICLQQKSEVDKGLLPKELYEDAKCLLLQGLTRRQVANKFNVSLSAIRKVIGFFNLQLRYIKTDSIETLNIDIVKSLLKDKQHVSRANVAKILNVSVETLRTFCKRHGISTTTGDEIEKIPYKEIIYKNDVKQCDINNIIDDINQMMIKEEIMKKYSISSHLLNKFMKKYNLSFKTRWIGKTKFNNENVARRGQSITKSVKKNSHWCLKAPPENVKIFGDSVSYRRKEQFENGTLKNHTWISYSDAINKQQKLNLIWSIIKIPTEQEFNNVRSGISLNATLKCLKCGCHTEGIWRLFLTCNRTCKCTHPQSKFELEISNFVESHISIMKHDRKIIKPYELDIVIPEKLFAIECNGLYWHSTATSTKACDWHEFKRIKCLENNVMLFHIFEDEWKFKKDIIKSIILRQINKSLIEYDIQQLRIVHHYDSNELRIFFDENYIDGFDDKSYYAISLQNNNEILAGVLLRQSLKENIIEIDRIAIKNYCNINNVILFLLQEIMNVCVNFKFNGIKFYQDLRFGDKIYTNLLDFTFMGLSNVIVWNTNKMKRFIIDENQYYLQNNDIYQIGGTSSAIYEFKN
jgi:hypothetical protein